MAGVGPADDARALRRAVLASVAVALFAQAWVLTLPLRLDDYALLRDPAGLWAELAAVARRDAEPRATIFRPALWSLWWLVRAATGEPVRALPYHLVGWLVHGVAAGAVAAAVGRLAGARAALLGGALAGAAAGGIQAVAWTAAQGDLLVGAAVALAAALAAWGRPRAAVVALAVAPLAKVTGFVAAVVAGGLAVALLTAGGPRASARRAAARRFALGAAAVLALALVARFAFVGGVQVATGVPAPGLPGPLASLSGAGGALAQALVPIDRDPACADLRPLAAALLGARAQAAGLLLLLPLAAAGLAAPGARRRVGLLALAAAVLVLPAGAMFAGPGSNHQARHLYPALLALAAALGVALDALLARRPALGAALGLLAAAVTLDGLVHVARVERAGARVFAASRAALEAAADEHAREAGAAGRPLEVYLLRGREGPGSTLAGTARAFDAALAPPYRDGPPVRVHGVPDRADLEARLAALELAHADAAVFGPDPRSLEPPAVQGAERRAELVLRRWTPTARGLLPAASPSGIPCRIAPLEAEPAGPDGGAPGAADAPGAPSAPAARVYVDAPGTAARVLALDLPAGDAVELRLRPTYATADAEHAARVPASAAPRRVVVALAPELARGFAPLRHVDVRGAVPVRAAFLDALPACKLELLAPSPFELDPADPLALAVRLPAEARGATRVRFDLRLRPPPERWPFSADLALDPAVDPSAAPLAFRVERVHCELMRDGPPSALYPWAVALADVILPILRAQRVEGGELAVRARALHASGLEAARSPWVTVPYRVPRGR